MDSELIAARLDQISSQLNAIETRSELVHEKLKAVEGKQPATPAKENWRSIVVQIIAVPAALIALFLQFNQAKNLPVDREKEVAEIAKTRTEELKTRAELQGILDGLAEKRGKSLTEYQRQLNDNLPRLEAVLGRMRDLNETSRADSAFQLLMRYVLLYIFWNAIRLVFNAVHAIWGPLIGTVTVALRNRAYNAMRKGLKVRWEPLINLFSVIVAPLPSVVHTVIEVAFFVAVLWPLFDLLSASLGSGVRFQQIAASFAHLNFTQAIIMLKSIIIGVGR
jgi:hypothetical protein